MALTRTPEIINTHLLNDIQLTSGINYLVFHNDIILSSSMYPGLEEAHHGLYIDDCGFAEDQEVLFLSSDCLSVDTAKDLTGSGKAVVFFSSSLTLLNKNVTFYVWAPTEVCGNSVWC